MRAHLAVVVLLVACKSSPPRLAITETPIGAASLDKHGATFSADGRHIAFAVQADGKFAMALDGKPGVRYDKVRSPVLSSDGAHFAYVGKLGDKETLVFDGKPLGQYDYVGTMVFSSNGNRFAFVTMTGDKWQVIVDGVAGTVNGAIDKGSLRFSPDGSHVAYIGKRGDKITAIVDDKVISDAYPDVGGGTGIVFSNDGKRVAFVAVAPDDEVIVLDGKPQKHYRAVGSFHFSPDGKHVAYVAFPGAHGACVVYDGKEGPPFDGIAEHGLLFTADSQHLAYAGFKNGKQQAVLDGVIDPPHSGIAKDSLKFSSDGKRLIYTADDGDNKQIVGGVTSKPYDRIAAPSFLGTSERLVFRATKDEKQFVVIDGVEGPVHKVVTYPVADPSGKHVAYITEDGEDQPMRIVVDGIASDGYDNFVPGSQLVFDGANALYVFGVRNDKILALKIDVAQLPSAALR